MPDATTGLPNGFLTPEPVLFRSGARGFALFGAGHLAWLLSCAAFVAWAVWWHGRATPGRRKALLRVLSAVPVAMVVTKSVTYVVLGVMEPLFWPLHLCNLSECVAFAYALTPQGNLRTRLADLLFCWAIPGCVAALVWPGWSPYCPAWSAASACGFAEHALVLACTLCVATGGEWRPQPRRAWGVIALTVACGALFRVVNPLLGTNFFFVTDPAAPGGPGPWLVRTFGETGCLAAALVLLVALWAGEYGAWRLWEARRRT